MTLSRRLRPIVAACCLFAGGSMGLGAYGTPPEDTAPHGIAPQGSGRQGIGRQGIGPGEIANICEQAGIAAEQASGLAFEPNANARYAAAFLLSLFSRAGTWEAAVEAYHSADPVLGFTYRQSVYASWLTAAPVTSPVRVGPVPPRVPKPPAMPFVYAGVTVWTPRFADGAGEVVVMPGAPAAQTQGVASRELPVVSYPMPRYLMPHR